MQHHMGQLDEETKNMEDQLYATERERDKALDELRAMKKLAQNSSQEIQDREKIIASLRLQLEKAKGLELQVAEKDAAAEKLSFDLAKTTASLKESERRARDLEMEMFDSLVARMKKLEEAEVSLEESRLEIESLRGELKANKSGRDRVLAEENGGAREAMESLESELCMAREKLESLVDEADSLRGKLKLATVAEETSKKALDDLALALKEVATEASQVREELGIAKAELEHSRSEEERLASVIKSNDEKYRRLVEEAMKEAERYKNTAERLRLEAEETLLAWNDKEIGLVDCLRKADEERASAQQENTRLLDLVSEAENVTMTSKEENGKLRDILKQALNESNTAKEAAEIARLENSQLKDRLAERDEALVFVTRENENYRLNEAAALENIKELKRLLCEVEKESTKEQSNKVGKTLSFNLKDKDNGYDRDERDPIDEALRGTIFDVARDPVRPETLHHQRKKSSCAFGSVGEGVEQVKLEDFEGNIDGTNLDDCESDRGSRKKRALLRRFGDLLMRKRGIQRKELSE